MPCPGTRLRALVWHKSARFGNEFRLPPACLAAAIFGTREDAVVY